MKKIFAVLLCLLFFAGSMRSANPEVIFPGDYPDPTILRDGDDYYMTHTPNFYQPGFLIWHSRDLVNWEPLTRAVPEFQGWAWAPDLIKHNGRFYLYYPSEGSIWVSYADKITGPWSKPVDLKVIGIDPGHVADADGNRYLYVNKGEIITLTPDGLSTVGEKRKVYDGWEYPSNWETEGMCLESPKLTYKDGYYYLTCAEGGTAGPATSHMIVSARSKNIDGPWENSPYNPIVRTWSPTESWWSKGHGTLVEDPQGNWWVVYHAYANGYRTLGRQTLIEPVEWTSDGWFTATSRPLPAAKIGFPDISDDFRGDRLGWQWTGWKENPSGALRFTPEGISIRGKGTTPADARLLLTTPMHKNYTAEVRITCPAKGSAGLLLFYNDKAFAGVMCEDGKKFTVYRSADDSLTVPDTLGRTFYAKLHNRCNTLSVCVSADGKAWTTLAEGIDVSGMNHNNYSEFLALRPALAVTGKGNATFSDFRYADAVPSEKDMAAYLMVYHSDDTHSLHMALSRDGYTFTSLNGGAPVINGDSIADQHGIRDPHIFRGPDGAFYLSMTDLHIYAQREGFRDTEWERPGKDYGWGNNRGLVLLKSYDLLNWKRANLRFDTLSAAWKEIGCAWAPEVTYDEERGKLMLYLTMRHRKEPNKLYYTYVNEAFDTLEGLPQLLFQYPDESRSAIDGDIIKVGDRYILSYVAHDGPNGIKQAVSDRPDGGWVYSPRWIDFEPKSCEAPNVWKRIGEDKWVLMYDIFSIQPHNFGFAETSDFVNFTHLGHFNEGVMKTTNFTSPKHGAVVHLTADEADRLERYWASNPRPFLPRLPQSK